MTGEREDGEREGVARLPTGVRNLDDLLGGGLPRGAAVVLAGPPGSGKTILAQQLCFRNATPERPVLYFSTLSEPTAKTLRYVREFAFFAPEKVDAAVQFVDVGALVRSDGLEDASRLIMEQVKRVRPSIVVVDSFKALDDLAASRAALRKFGYALAVSLMAWETTTLLLGEYCVEDVATNPLFSIVDGLVLMSQRREAGEQQRFLQVMKMRGIAHSRDEHPFEITREGIAVFAPRITFQREDRDDVGAGRCKTGVSNLDLLLGDGIPRGSSLLVAGVAGTGKTVLLLEFLYRGALAGEPGIFVSFEETEGRLRAAARGLGWDLDAQIEAGLVEVVFIPQPSIQIERDLQLIRERVERLGAKRVAIDSVSVFLHRLVDPQQSREKVFQLATIVQNVGAVGFFATDVPYGKSQISRFGVEETVVDGVILLSLVEEGLERERYLEVYKLRNTAHLSGRHNLTIGRGGITLFPRYSAQDDAALPPPPIDPSRRLSTGVARLDALLGGGLLARSVTLLSGSAGIGKSTFAVQFALAGSRDDRALYVALEEGPAQLLASARSLGLPLDDAVREGRVELRYLPRERVRPNQFLALLTDAIRLGGARRVVIDSVNHLAASTPSDALHELLYALATRFKGLDVTTVLTHEASVLQATHGEPVTDERFSAVADNIVVLRYGGTAGELRPTLTALKTRGSAHDAGIYEYAIRAGGVHIGERVADAPPSRGGDPGGGA